MNNTLQSGTILRGKSYTYTIQKVLGQGTFGITYLATTQVKVHGALGELETTMQVAVKEFFMRDINGRDENTVTTGSKGGIYANYKKKFAREAENLSKLKHPHIVKVLEFFEANNTVYYAMEYVEGGNLDNYIMQQNGLPEAECVEYIRQIGSALSYMHAHKMLHLDLKPGNVMLRKNGEAVLIDFGLSKQYDENGEPESSTNVGSGTPGYAPIEQANYHEGKDFPVTMDVYALGATLFKMLTGVRPPEASVILNEGFPAYELQKHHVSNTLIAQITKAMADKKKDRPQSVDAFLQGLGGKSATIKEEDEKTDYKDEKTEYKKEPIQKKVVQPTVITDSTVTNKEKRSASRISKKLKTGMLATLGIVSLAVLIIILFTGKKGEKAIQTPLIQTGDSCLLYQPFQDEQGKWGFIGIGKQFEKKIIPPKYDDADLFSNGRARVKLNGLYGYIDKYGMEIIPPRYKKASNFKQDCAFVKTDDKYTLIDTCGKEITPPIFDEYEFIDQFEKGLNAVKTGDKWGFIDKNGQWVIPAQYDHASNFRSGLAKVYNAPDDYYINPQGKTVYPPLFDEWLYDPGDGTCIAFKKDDKYGFADSTGRIIIQPQYRMAYSFSEGLAYVEDIQGGTGFINMNGEYVIPPVYQFNGPTYCKESRIIVNNSGHEGFMDKNGKKITPIQYDYVNSFENGFARVAYKDEARMKSIYIEYAYGYINRDGKEIIPCLYEELRYLPDFALFCAQRADSFYYIDTIGNIKATLHP